MAERAVPDLILDEVGGANALAVAMMAAKTAVTFMVEWDMVKWRNGRRRGIRGW